MTGRFRVGDRVRTPAGTEGTIRAMRPAPHGLAVSVAIDRNPGYPRLAPGGIWRIETYRAADLTPGGIAP